MSAVITGSPVENTPSKSSMAKWQLLILIGLVLIRGLIYLSVFPPWIAPDEPSHFEAIRILGQQQQIPYLEYYQTEPVNWELAQNLQTFRMWEFVEASTPTNQLNQLQKDTPALSFITEIYPGTSPIAADERSILPHLLLAPLSFLFQPFDIVTELYILRFASVLIAVVLTVVAWLVTKKVFPRQPQFWLAIPAFVVFLPMRTHIFASVNADVFAVLLGSTLLLLFVVIFDKGLSPTNFALTLALILLAFFTKRTVLFVVLWAGFAATLYLGYRRGWSNKQTFGVTLTASAGIGAIFTWVILQFSSFGKVGSTVLDKSIFSKLYIFSQLNQNTPLFEIINTQIQLILFAFITFWGVFGFNNINLPWPWFWGLVLFCAILLVGITIYLIKLYSNKDTNARFQQMIFAIFIVGIVLAVGSAFFPSLFRGPKWGPQARYYFPAIIPIATFLYLGFWQLFPGKYRQYVPLVWLVLLVGFDTLVLTQVLIPYFYG